MSDDAGGAEHKHAESRQGGMLVNTPLPDRPVDHHR